MRPTWAMSPTPHVAMMTPHVADVPDVANVGEMAVLADLAYVALLPRMPI